MPRRPKTTTKKARFREPQLLGEVQKTGEYKDVMADLKFRKKTSKYGGNVQRSLVMLIRFYDEVEKEVLGIIDGKWFNIYVTGHPLGGASAVLCTNRLEEKFARKRLLHLWSNSYPWLEIRIKF